MKIADGGAGAGLRCSAARLPGQADVGVGAGLLEQYGQVAALLGGEADAEVPTDRLAFIGRHFMLTKVRGRFTGVTGTIAVAEEPGESTAEVTIDMASVESGSPAHDDHLRSPDFFDVAHHPTASFSGRAAGWRGTRGLLAGELTIRGVSRPVTLHADYLGHVADPWGGQRAIFTAEGTLNREDWGLTWNMPLDGGGLLVSKDIRVEIEAEAVLEP